MARVPRACFERYQWTARIKDDNRWQTMTHPYVERVVRAFRERDVSIHVVEFAESTRTAAEAAAVVGVTVAQIAKSLVFLAGEDKESATLVLVIASGVNRVSETKLAARVGGPVRRADADTVKRVTGFSVGGVPPIGHASPVRVLIDQDLLQYPEVWAAAGTAHHNFAIRPDALVQASGGEVADVREEPR
jgi:prolyl-tRNA editing enzyme YbaK/EbsC (Cys-tRNA(Pro) deacylase)